MHIKEHSPMGCWVLVLLLCYLGSGSVREDALVADRAGSSPLAHAVRETCTCTCTPPPPCISYALVQATVGVGTVLIWDLILIRYQT